MLWNYLIISLTYASFIKVIKLKINCCKKKEKEEEVEVTTNPSRYGNDVGRSGFCLVLQSNLIFNSLQKSHICKCSPSRLEFGSPPLPLMWIRFSLHCPHPCRIHKITITQRNIFCFLFYLGEGLGTNKRWILATQPSLPPPTLNIGKKSKPAPISD